MTATFTAVDLDVAVKRADGRWATRNGDEPASLDYLKHMADAVRPLLGQPSGPVDDVQVQQLLADKQRLNDLAEELRKQADTRGKVIDRQTRDLAALKKQLTDAETDSRRRIDAAVSAVTADGEKLREEADRLRQALVLRTGELDEARVGVADLQAAELVEQLKADNAALAEQLAVAQQAAPHHHQYVVDAPGSEPRPCECGQPYPRTVVVTEPVKPSTPEPWADLFGQIRADARKAGWKT